jgi:hypothetical protein
MLRVTRSFVHGLGGTAVFATRCQLTLDRDYLSSNVSGAIVASASIYDVRNCIIVENGPNAVAVDLSINSMGTFQFNTVAANTNNSGAAAIDCGVTAKAIDDSIVWNNGKGANGSQLFGMCTLTNCDVSEVQNGVGNLMLAPAFTPTYRLTSAQANLDCCVDKIAAAALDHDVDGNPRPQPKNGRWDIGAFELPQ